jgi:hypothetical protein
MLQLSQQGIISGASGGGGGSSVTFIGGDAYEWEAPGAGTRSAPVPVGTQEDDLCVLFIHSRNSRITSVSGGTTWHLVQGGETTVAGGLGGSSNEEVEVWWKYAGGSEPANWSVVMTDEGTDAQAIAVAVFRDAMPNEHSVAVSSDIPGETQGTDGIENGMVLLLHGTSYDETVGAATSAPAGTIQIGYVYGNSNFSRVGSTHAYKALLATEAIGDISWSSAWDTYETSWQLSLRPKPTALPGVGSPLWYWDTRYGSAGWNFIYDLSGNGRDALYSNGAHLLGGLGDQALNCDGGNDYIISEDSGYKALMVGGDDNCTLFVALTIDTHESGQGVFAIQDSENSGTPWVLCQMTGTNTIQFYLNGGYHTELNIAYTPGTPFVICLRYDATAGEWESFKDGVSDGTVLLAVGAMSGTYMYLGNGYNGYLDGKFYASLGYSTKLTDQEVADISAAIAV